jgi:hypothetical protein
VDWLEGRRLLSRSTDTNAAVAFVVTPDQDDDRAEVETPAGYARAVSTLATPLALAAAAKTPIDRARAEPELAPDQKVDAAESDDETASRVPAPKPPAAAESTVVVGAGPGFAFASETPVGNQPREAGRRADLPANTLILGPAPTSSLLTDRLTSAPSDESNAASLPPATSPTAPEPSPEVDIPEAEIEPHSGMPPGAGLIAYALPFKAEVLSKALDEALEQFGDVGVLDVIESIVTPRMAAFGAACVVTLGAVEIARRLHRRDSEGSLRRVPSVTMVPGLWPARRLGARARMPRPIPCAASSPT